MKIVLVRHGRSSHVVKGLLDHAAFLRWRDAYEGAGIDANDAAPPELIAVARDAGVLVSSDIRRAMESASVLAPDREVVTSALLRELTLLPPKLRWIRLPLIGWALTFAFRKLATAEEEVRAQEAAQWLIDLSSRYGDVVAVTHASFRSMIAKELAKGEWTSITPRRSSHHWSAWAFTKRGDQ